MICDDNFIYKDKKYAKLFGVKVFQRLNTGFTKLKPSLAGLYIRFDRYSMRKLNDPDTT